MTDYQNNVISIMKISFGIAAVDITNDILDAVGLDMAALGSDSIGLFAKVAKEKAKSLISEKEAEELYKKLTSL